MAACNKNKLLGWFFIGTVIYALVAMTLCREVLIPRSLPAIEGHILGDPYYYHTLAVKQSELLSQQGMSAFKLRPEGQGPAGLASLVYASGFGTYGVVLLNALLHGLAAAALCSILMYWFSPGISILAAMPLAISPYMIVWLSQINKESTTMCGVLLFVHGLTKLIKQGETPLSRANNLALASVATGMFLVWTCRPYVNMMLLPATALVFVLALLAHTRSKALSLKKGLVLGTHGLLVLACLGALTRGAASDETLESFKYFQPPENHQPVMPISQPVMPISQPTSPKVSEKCLANIAPDTWRNSGILPEYVDQKLKAMMGQRCLVFTILDTHTNRTTLNSVVDINILPASSMEALYYAPRALLLGVFSPWPNNWPLAFADGISVFYTFVSLEAVALYAGLLGLSFWVWRTRKWGVLVPVVISVSMMGLYAMATPFIGALYRYRYPWWVLLMGFGLAALADLLRRSERAGGRMAS